MKGAIAAGHPLTADAGARILAEGGNAVDACIAAAFVSWVAESPLTGPGGGGFLLVHRASDRSDALLDFFVAVPGQGGESATADMAGVDVSFDGRTTQLFRVGAASCAVPGSVAGLAEAHRLYGSLPWRALLEPAIELAEGGVVLTESQASLHHILDPVLRFEPEIEAIYGGDSCLREGETLRLGDLADTLRMFTADGAASFYRGELARRISTAVRSQGGRVTEKDLRAYRVVRRRPVRVRFRGHEVVANPPPSSGGALVSFALALLERVGEPAGRSSLPEAAFLAEVMREASRVRDPAFAAALHRGGLVSSLLSEERLCEAVESIRRRTEPAREPTGLPSTTHVSVLDARGNAASLSASTGCGSGVVVPGTGIHLNNMLGEVDLNPSGTAEHPGRRLTSMMAPSLVLHDRQPRLVIGSAGSERLRGAILQTVLDVVGRERPLAEAIGAPRLHVDGDRIHVEGGFDSQVADGLEALGYDLVRWDRRSLYFGGVSAVALGPEGPEASGDPRRGGAGVVVA